jgi:hypothetical protein
MKERELQNLLTEDVCIGDLILAQNSLKVLDQGYQGMNVETPEWITDKTILVSDEIQKRLRSERAKKLKTLKARRAQLATPDEKRNLLDQEIAALEKNT